MKQDLEPFKSSDSAFSSLDDLSPSALVQMHANNCSDSQSGLIWFQQNGSLDKIKQACNTGTLLPISKGSTTDATSSSAQRNSERGSELSGSIWEEVNKSEADIVGGGSDRLPEGVFVFDEQPDFSDIDGLATNTDASQVTTR